MTGIIITVVTFILMEAITWLSHKYVMHGFLWSWHRDHHDHSSTGSFEKNDRFFLVFAVPAIIFLAAGTWYSEWRVLLFIGLGITLYGLSYFFVHDIFIHQRFDLFKKTNNRYFQALRKAHKVHHKHLGKEQGECFGMLFVPFRYFREAKRSKG